ncbi:MAG TPA: Clp protease ClpP [bacterium]|nr:Clp protease ClpP [bacterium]HPN46016.1 Clp protease ClpP [bacterium]
MGFYSDFLNKNLSFDDLNKERKKQLQTISKLRNNRDILVFASDLTKNIFNSIDYSDILPFQDQLSNLNGESIDIILETPGGYAEVVEDLVKLVRKKYDKVGIIIPGWAKSAGTIFALAGDEILMGPTSGLGPIDAQIILSNNKKYSAEAFLEGLEKIKKEIEKTGKLNPAYIPILQNISPGEIQHCENAQNFSQKLVTDWLSNYKFKFWDTHKSSKKVVTKEEKEKRAKEIANELCKQSKWLTHSRSIKIDDFEELKLQIYDYSKNKELNDAIMKYYTLMRMSFEVSNMVKIYETIESQIYKFAISQKDDTKIKEPIKQNNEIVEIHFKCPNCKKESLIQANLEKSHMTRPNFFPYPVENNVFKCPYCGSENNILELRMQIESQSGKKIVK